MTWEKFILDNKELDIPKPRASHCAININNRLYMWSGRRGNYGDGRNDFWVCLLNFKDISIYYHEYILSLCLNIYA